MPYPNEHACRLNDPKKYKRFIREDRESASMSGKKYQVIRGFYLKDGKEVGEDQAYRYPKKNWTADQSRRHCQAHKGSFEAASKELENCDCNVFIPDFEYME